MSDASAALTLFSLKNGVVESGAEQPVVDAFAADFQGLRHFGSKVGDALDLGSAWTGTLQEEDLTLAYAYFGDSGPDDPGAGAMVGNKVLLFELLSKITVQEA